MDKFVSIRLEPKQKPLKILDLLGTLLIISFEVCTLLDFSTFTKLMNLYFYFKVIKQKKH